MSQDQYQLSGVAAPDELAAMHQLGEQIDSFPYQKAKGIAVVIVFLLVIIGEVIIGLPFGLVLVFVPFLLNPANARESMSPLAQVAISVLGVLLVAVFLAVIGLCVKRIITSCRGFGATIYLYKNGLIQTKGNKADVLRWDQVSDVRELVHRGGRFNTTHTYTLRLVDGRKFIFNDLFQNVQLLGSYLMQRNQARQPNEAKER